MIDFEHEKCYSEMKRGYTSIKTHYKMDERMFILTFAAYKRMNLIFLKNELYR